MTHALLRFATAGSVDDGKSTLVGRLMFDTKTVLADQLDAIERVSNERGMESVDLALLTDGLRAEREQGITIDVAYRYFSTPNRSFILADTPGHVQYTRNMVTGASTAELALILIDVRHGVVEQTRRHAAIAALLGVRHVTVAVNKMDLVNYSETDFNSVKQSFLDVAAPLGISDITVIPVSALIGDNVVDASQNTPWYNGPTLLEHLETVPVGIDPRDQPFRLPVQYVNRPRTAEFPDYRGFAGRIASGVIRVGDEIVVNPLGRTSTVKGIDILGTSAEVAFAPQSVTLLLTDEIDMERGDVISRPETSPTTTQEVTATVCVLADSPISKGQRLLARFGPKTVRVIVTDVVDRLDLNSLEHESHTGSLELNDVGTLVIRLADEVSIDNYDDLRTTSAFILIDDQDGSTLAAGMTRC